MSWPISTSLPFENTRELIRDFLNLVFFFSFVLSHFHKMVCWHKKSEGNKSFFC